MKQTGFTLIELMVTVMVVAVLASIALPSYQEYSRRQRLATAKQEMMVIAGELERFKSKNFTYRNFDLRTVYPSATSPNEIELPINESTKHYTIRLVDTSTNLANPPALNDTAARGYSWAMSATRSNASATDQKNYDGLMTSAGLSCKTKEFNEVKNLVGRAKSEEW